MSSLLMSICLLVLALLFSLTAPLHAAGPARETPLADVLKQLQDEDFEQRLKAVQHLHVRLSLSSLRVADKEAIADGLIRVLRDESATVRREAARTLGGLDRDTKKALAALLKTLVNDENPIVRCAAAYSAGRLDQGTKAALPGLRKAAKDDDGPLRVAAHTALWRITGEDASRKYVIDALKDESSEVRREAVSALASRVGDDKSIVGALVPMLGDNHRHVRREALLV